MVQLALLFALSGPAAAGSTRIQAAEAIIAQAGLPLPERLDHDQTIGTAELLLHTAGLEGWLTRQHAGAATTLLFELQLSAGRVRAVTVRDDPLGLPRLSAKVARKLRRARAGHDIDAHILVPVVVGTAP